MRFILYVFLITFEWGHNYGRCRVIFSTILHRRGLPHAPLAGPELWKIAFGNARNYVTTERWSEMVSTVVEVMYAEYVKLVDISSLSNVTFMDIRVEQMKSERHILYMNIYII